MKENFYNLSNPQKSILLTEQYYQNTNINNICGTAIVDEVLDFNLLEKAINNVIKENDSFLIKLSRDGNTFIQSVKEYEFIKIEHVKLDSKNDVSKLEQETLKTIFNLEDKLFEFKMFEFPDKTGGFLLNIHHLIADGWTLGLVCRKIMISYSKLTGNDLNEDISSSYIEYTQSETEYEKSAKFENDKKYWDEVFSTIPNSVTIPGSINSIENFSCEAHRESFIVPKKLVKNIQDYCTKSKASVFNFFMAVLAVYIQKINNTDDFVIGTPILNRANFKEKNTSGMFINVSPLRISIDSNKTFLEFISDISHSSRDLLKHQKYPYINILQNVRAIDYSVPNLYNIVLSYQLTRANNVANYNYETRWAFNGNVGEDIEIQLYDLDETGSLNLTFDYKINKYTKKDIVDLKERLFFIISQIIENDENLKLNDIHILPKKEEDFIVYNLNNETKLNYPKNKTIYELFEEQAINESSKTAVVFEDTSLTFDELNKKANNLAYYLKKNNISNGDIVGILLNRSIEMLICMMGILKAGATYVPIDPTYPEHRVKYILENSNSKILLSEPELLDKFDVDCKIINAKLDNKEIYNGRHTENLNIEITSDNLAYIIYTSGSTGNPKGVMITHRNVVNFIHGMKDELKFKKNLIMGSVTTNCFDIFVLESLLPLCLGMTTVIANNSEQTIPQNLNKMCINNNVKILQTTPSKMNLLISDENSLEYVKNLKYILIGGETVPANLVKKLKTLTDAKIFNMYGPSETTVWSTFKDLTDVQDVTIGKPIANTYTYILDDNLNVLPIGVSGNLYIGGDGVGKGYLNREDLTEEKFIDNPFVPNTKMYNTGDVAKLLPNGDIEYIGRSDFQVKLHGLRIELRRN